MKEIFELEFCGKKLTVETGEMAKQASGSVLIRYEDTVILSVVTASKKPKDLDFFPLTVTYEEKLYAVGKIPGGFLKREGRPSEHATLCSRLIDRPLRPLFADGFRNDVQVVNTVLSVDQDSSPEMMAMLGSSLALMISDIPFNGPIAGVYVGRVDGQYIINPSLEQSEASDIDLAIAGTKTAINMVEASSKEVSEEAMLEALMFGHEHIKQLIAFQEGIVAKVGKPKRAIDLYTVEQSVIEQVESLAKAKLVDAVKITKKQERYDLIAQIESETIAHFEGLETTDSKTLKYAKEALHDIVKDEVRRLITVDKIRPDGRRIDEIRPLNSRINLLPRVHGSAMFTRGETQVLSVATLGALNEHQRIDGLTDQETKRFMHHYNFPPYSVGETGRMGAPGRREIGHGALGERALAQVIPSEDVFPYTIRVVSEVLESNGSSSQASICASTMALMQAGVPISAPVAGIAMGLIQQGDDYTILSDIQGMEDHLGDMDFKVAGTEKGIVALQMDIKIEGLSKEILEEALAQAKTARAVILENMMDCINEVSPTLSEYAPKMELFFINPDKIRDVIGPGGKMINHIIDSSNNVKIDIEDDGKVVIYHTDAKAIATAKEMIENLTRTAKLNEVYPAKVVRIEKFGAFLQLFPGCDGLLHISKLANTRVERVEDVVKMGDIIEVKVVKIDEKGRVDLVRNDLPEKTEATDVVKGESDVKN